MNGGGGSFVLQMKLSFPLLLDYTCVVSNDNYDELNKSVLLRAFNIFKKEFSKKRITKACRLECC